MTDVRGKRILVVGLARSGRAVARCLGRRGAVVTVTDIRHPQTFSTEVRELMQEKIGLELGCHREETFLHQDLIIVSPGVPSDLPPLKLARKNGIPVFPEIEVAGWFLQGRRVGITGTNGKTTTTALTGKILKAAGFAPFVGGNIGVPLITAVDCLPAPSVLVVELSSFQLEMIQSFRAHVAVLLNLSPNHLDRHPSFEAYVQAKARIFRNQTADDYAILNADDPEVMKLKPGIRSQKVFFSRRRELASGVFVSGGHICYRVRHLERILLEASEVRLRGDFNLENVLAASAAACVLGADFAALRQAVCDFGGVEHRLEFVREIGGVSFYNDSKATSVDAAAKALSTFERGVHLVLGGKDKGAPYAPLRPWLKNRVREVLLIGAAAGKIGCELEGAAELIPCGTLEAAMREAFRRAQAGDVVLLAPACSSFDQFEDFEHRGRVFKQLVSVLAVEYQQSRNRPREVPPPAGGSVKDTRADAPAEAGPQFTLEAQPSMPSASPVPEPQAETPPEVKPEPELPALSEPAASAPRLRVERELEYVYEVSAEEVAPAGEADFSPEPLIEDRGSEGASVSDPIGDEPMGYEVRIGKRTPVKSAKQVEGKSSKIHPRSER